MTNHAMTNHAMTNHALKHPWICFALLLLLGACQPSLRADVTHFYSLPPLVAGETFAIAPEPEQASDLAFQYYSGLMSNALLAKGFRPASTQGAPADLVAVMHYGNLGNHTEVYSDPPPPAWYRHGWWGPAYPPMVSSYTLYVQSVDLALFDGPAWRAGERRALFQARAVTDSGAQDLNRTMPYLIQALLAEFPGVNGQTVQVVMPMGDAP